ncbi:cryptochrome/photolyase family protein [Flexivirga meconopsidis]|uniref:cryptochrome/photolyase family protein n=1 Tax=Flexivirga meconopsidis TaxID=2977121 RepID=UPI00223F2B39
MPTPAILWLRRDLRRHDHPALGAATAAAGRAGVLPVFVIDPVLWEGAGPVRRRWLADTLRTTSALYDDKLAIRVGDPRDVLPALAAETAAGSVHVTRETTPYGARRDAQVAERLRAADVDFTPTGTPYAIGPGIVRTQGGTPFQVFTPFSRAWRDHGRPAPAPDPKPTLHDAGTDLAADELLTAATDFELAEPLPDAGEPGALARWAHFLDRIDDYDTDRDRPDLDGTSRLSPYLKLGAIHPRTLLADLAEQHGPGVDRFVTELAWREFYADVLHHHPRSAWHDLRDGLQGMAYDDPGEEVDAWREGRTGFPIVDAGMRQLARTGWMANRARMITASFLTKDLHIWWPVGARHFLDHLIDGDLASNNHGWQWVAGTGTDAAPYFRIFNPVTQGIRFDPDGAYVRRWVPELAHLPGRAAHEPWKHDDGYDHGYPEPIVDHAAERRDALARYDAARR